MARLRLFPAVVALAAWASSAHADAFRKGPYLQSGTRTQVTIMWESDSSAPGRIHVVSPGEPERVVEAPAAQLHEVRVSGLTPGRRYAYQVECAGQTSGGELTTAPEATEPFSFVVFGDTRSSPDQHRGVVERARREVPDFILHTGDLVDDGSLETDWKQFFDVERELLRDNVIYPAVGNHDRQGRARTAETFRKYFSLPDDSPDPERYYQFTYGNSRFLILDSNEYSFALTDQTAWLERELAAAAADPRIAHRFVVMHHPPFSTSLHGGQPELREMWTPLFERYGVEAVFSGHDHTYQRAERNGVRYFVTAGGGAPLYPRVHHPSAQDLEAEIYFERTLHYLRVQVVGAFVEVAAVREDGTLVETLSWGSLPERLVATRPPEPQPAPTQTASPVPVPARTRTQAAAAGGCQVMPGSSSAAWLPWCGVAAWLWIRRKKRPV